MVYSINFLFWLASVYSISRIPFHGNQCITLAFKIVHGVRSLSVGKVFHKENIINRITENQVIWFLG